MALVRFKLDEVKAFKDGAQGPDDEHFCVGCAREVRNSHGLVPFLDGQLHAALSDFGQDAGAVMSCDQCGGLIAAHCPETLWGGNKEQKKEGASAQRSPVLFRQF